MTHNIIDNFIEKKDAESSFVTLKDGDSVVVKAVKEIKVVTKTGFGGEEKEVIRLIVDVETSEGIREKYFDNSTKRWAEELGKHGITVGSSFTITREGEQTKTRYTISEMTDSGEAKTDDSPTPSDDSTFDPESPPESTTPAS